MSRDVCQGWNVRTILRAIWGDCRRYPVMVLFGLGVVPALYNLPCDLAQRAFDSARQGPFKPNLAMVLALVVMKSLWRSALSAGVILMGLDVAEGRRPRLSSLWHGTRYFIPMAVVNLALDLPFEIVTGSQSSTDQGHLLALHDQLAAAFASLFVAYVGMLRAIVIQPLIITWNASPWSSLCVSWRWTKGISWKLIRLYFALALLLAPVILLGVAGGNAITSALGMVPLHVVMTLMTVQIYVRLASEHRLETTTPEQAGAAPDIDAQ